MLFGVPYLKAKNRFLEQPQQTPSYIFKLKTYQAMLLRLGCNSFSFFPKLAGTLPTMCPTISETFCAGLFFFAGLVSLSRCPAGTSSFRGIHIAIALASRMFSSGFTSISISGWGRMWKI